ncbi:MAG: endolytic transglycosylase MltG, partial [Actinobacteria bacterium]|nr:endolytic transglycosylase MltG [Actinomycetota bacterium]
MFKRLLIFFLFVFVILFFLFIWWKDAISPVDKKDIKLNNFVISEGSSVKQIASDLKSKGYIKDQIAFFVYVRLSGLSSKIQAGNFRLSKSMDIVTIANSLTHGTNDLELTIIEGWRVEEIASVVSQTFGLPENDFLKYAEEGRMFPDTYLIPKEVTAQKITELIEKNFNSKVNADLINTAESKGLNINKVLILASIVEREAAREQDRPIIAGILLKRYKNGWPLQADATIQYALGYQSDEKTWWKKALTINDLRVDSPYNTYINPGLPPGPISNPGM